MNPELGARFLPPEQRKAAPTPTCVAPMELRDAEAVHRDIDLFSRALKEATDYEEAFMCSASPRAVAAAWTRLGVLVEGARRARKRLAGGMR